MNAHERSTMMSNKKNQNTYYVTNEINYDKLAKAIVSALNEKDNEKKSETTISRGLAALCSIVFKLLSLLSLFMTIGFIAIPFIEVSTFEFTFPKIMLLIILITLFAVIAIFLWKASVEIENEKDKNYIISIFSSMVCVAAMVIAAVGLYYTISAKQ